MQRKKTTGDDNLPVDLLKKLGDSGLKIMTALINKIYMSGDWPKDFLDVTMIVFCGLQLPREPHRSTRLLQLIGRWQYDGIM